jgi:hypothetical protein
MKQQEQKQSSQQQQQGGESKVEGEGSYTAARRHRESAENFVQSGQVDKAAHEAAPKTDNEAQDLKKAEDAGVSHAKH